jgi:hypothetical protein
MRTPTLAFICISAVCNAQNSEIQESDALKGASFEVGQRINGYNAMEAGQSFGIPVPNLLHFGAGLAAKVMLGRERHWGVELSGYYSQSEKSFTGSYDLAGNYSSFGFRRHSFDINVQGQYHFGKEALSFRPYFGMGIGAARVYHTTEEEGSMGNSLDNVIGGGLFTPTVHFEQGFTHRISGSFSLMQSLFYRYEMDYGRSNVGLRLGFFYAL